MPDRYSSQSASSTPLRAPYAEKKWGHRVRRIHGDYVDDPWDWLRDKSNPLVHAHLVAENEWADHICEPTQPLADALAKEIRGYSPLSEVSVPVRASGYWWFTRRATPTSRLTHHRLPATGIYATTVPSPTESTPLSGEELVLDENLLARGHDFFRLEGLTPSPCGRYLAWARDLSGDERWTWVVQEASTGQVIDEACVGAGMGVAWASDSSAFIYTRVNDAWRQHEVWLHYVGQERHHDVLLLHEEDEGFDLWFAPSNDPDHVAIHATSTTTGQAWLWLTQAPDCPPLPATQRRAGVLLTVEPAGDHLLIVHSGDNPEGTLSYAPLPSDLVSLALTYRDTGVCEPLAPSSTWMSLREADRGERILGVEAWASFCVLSLRSGSLTRLEYRLRTTDAEVSSDVWAPARNVEVDSPVRTLELVASGPFDSTHFRILHQSVTVPPTWEEVEALTGKRSHLKTCVALGWDPQDYVEERVWVTARDGHTRIPVTLVRRADLCPDGTHAGWLHGYGAYEISFDAEFDVMRLPLLRRGIVHAIAHVRGGGELGRSWYEDGKGAEKAHTFTDFIDVGRWLIDSGWVAPDRLIAEGRSAGGLLMGAVANMAPDLFRVVLAGVPFVDALTTILDPSLPLTIGEWEEWGNPLEDQHIYALMRSYSPYENVPDGVRLPAVMATSGLNDTRVFFVEPTKWVQRLHEAQSSVDEARPVVLRTEMVAGHGGRSKREERWAARAQEFAFCLGQVGATLSVL